MNEPSWTTPTNLRGFIQLARLAHIDVLDNIHTGLFNGVEDGKLPQDLQTGGSIGRHAILDSI